MVDVCIRLGVENLLRLQTALRDLDPTHRTARPPIRSEHDADALRSFKNVCLSTKLGQLDCLGEVLGVGDFSAVENQSITIDLDGVPCRVISLDALIAAKKAMNRDRDRIAVDQLLRIKLLRENRQES